MMRDMMVLGLASLFSLSMFVGCESTCDNVEPCFSYMPYWAIVTLIDASTGEAIEGPETLWSNLEMECEFCEEDCEGNDGAVTCKFYVPETHDKVLLVIRADNYEDYNKTFTVETEPDQTDDGCTINGCVLSTNMPSTIELQPSD